MSEDYQSGPFCRHWDDPSMCSEVCAVCGHGCSRHGAEDGDFSCDECDCERWTEQSMKGQDTGWCADQAGLKSCGQVTIIGRFITPDETDA